MIPPYGRPTARYTGSLSSTIAHLLIRPHSTAEGKGGEAAREALAGSGGVRHLLWNEGQDHRTERGPDSNAPQQVTPARLMVECRLVLSDEEPPDIRRSDTRLLRQEHRNLRGAPSRQAPCTNTDRSLEKRHSRLQARDRSQRLARERSVRYGDSPCNTERRRTARLPFIPRPFPVMKRAHLISTPHAPIVPRPAPPWTRSGRPCCSTVRAPQAVRDAHPGDPNAGAGCNGSR